MFRRAVILLLPITAVLLGMIETERRYRELQALQARQVYQRQVLLDEQSRLRLELQQYLTAAETPDETR
ncbi:MAG: hypothetical protein ACE37I_19405 [Rubinisphaera brasiliensis]|uniref:Cell division protein, FtsL n=1 Tax=Rubinisphaera brasiliensis (strain ATCC 49424 / DSM 5305 / JCM 21570 / IAM 15109 / NBRC 103401 / IFAM 1448) TaxID=756272 RepID=F0SQF1_RUBBR|nr:hypothetical protein [Rubinisphaera brasiliensis]ADY57926.1 cell division protein, FtsL [Rubinisphaera brasiliensis DSM 5305]MBR9802200.1 hypothetical protein [bacterium]